MTKVMGLGLHTVPAKQRQMVLGKGKAWETPRSIDRGSYSQPIVETGEFLEKLHEKWMLRKPKPQRGRMRPLY